LREALEGAAVVVASVDAGVGGARSRAAVLILRHRRALALGLAREAVSDLVLLGELRRALAIARGLDGGAVAIARLLAAPVARVRGLVAGEVGAAPPIRAVAVGAAQVVTANVRVGHHHAATRTTGERARRLLLRLSAHGQAGVRGRA